MPNLKLPFLGPVRLKDGESSYSKLLSHLMIEINLNAGHSIKDHIILHDGRRRFVDWVFDNLSERTTKERIKKIILNFQFAYFGNVLCSIPKNQTLVWKIYLDQLLALIKTRVSY